MNCKSIIPESEDETMATFEMENIAMPVERAKKIRLANSNTEYNFRYDRYH